MCGRYYVDDATAREIMRIVHRVNEKFSMEAGELFTSGDIYPSGAAPILLPAGTALEARRMQWGFPGIRGKGVIFNARSETALEKRMFKDSLKFRRCIVPASAFYEWDKNKDKITFRRPDTPVLFMAGFYRFYPDADKNRTEDGGRFVILTTGANDSVSPIHERMPILLEERELEDWVFDDDFVAFVLHRRPGPLIWHKPLA